MVKSFIYLMGLVCLVLTAAIVTARSANTIEAADCRYASFDNGAQLGIIQVCGVVPGSTGTVRVNLWSNTPGHPELCSGKLSVGDYVCSARNPDVSGFINGCNSYEFAQGLSSETSLPTRIELWQNDYTGTFSQAELRVQPNPRVKRLVAERCYFNP